MTNWELSRLYNSLGDGLAWNLQGRTVTFESRCSATAFKRVAPAWTAQYRLGDQVVEIVEPGHGVVVAVV